MVHFLNGLSFCEELLWDDISAVWKGTNCCWYNTHRKWCGSFCWLSEMVVFIHQFLVMSSSLSPSPAPILERLPYCQPLEFWSTHYPHPSLAMPSASTASNLASKFAFFYTLLVYFDQSTLFLCFEQFNWDLVQMILSMPNNSSAKCVVWCASRKFLNSSL